jgi:hypothetical protein
MICPLRNVFRWYIKRTEGINLFGKMIDEGYFSGVGDDLEVVFGSRAWSVENKARE